MSSARHSQYRSFSSTWVSLSAVPGVGPTTLRRVARYLKQRRLNVAEWWSAPALWAESGLKQHQVSALEVFQTKYTPQEYAEKLAQLRVITVGWWQQQYPSWLRQISDCPWVLYLWGAGSDSDAWTQFWNKPAVAVVGTRQVTPYGQHAASKLVEQLVALGEATIVSGFMVGVDLAAHQAAVAAGGRTVCVLGYGQGEVYPSTLTQQYLEWQDRSQVVFVSEHPPGRSPRKGFFPLRNRIVAGLSQAVVVVEAATGSGSLITAELAAEYGRQVCGVPGSIFSPYTQGVISLAQQGAVWVSSGSEVLNQIGHQVPIPAQLHHALHDVVLQTLATDAATLDQLLQHTGWSPDQLLAHLTELELRGKVRRHGERWYLSG